MKEFEASSEAGKDWADATKSQFSFLSDQEKDLFILGINSTFADEYDNDDDEQRSTVPKDRLGGIVYPPQKRADDMAVRRKTDQANRKLLREGGEGEAPTTTFRSKRDTTAFRSKRDTSVS